MTGATAATGPVAVARPGGSPRRLRLAIAGAAVFLAAVAAAWLPSVAAAHGEQDPAIVAVVDDLQPSAPPVQAEVVPGLAARLKLTNRSDERLEVLDEKGVPFLRIGPDGVEANERSVTFYASGNPDGIGQPPKGVRAGGEPRWKRISRDRSWTYFDHRLHPAPAVVPGDLRAARKQARLSDWTVPLRLGGAELAVRGHVDYRPTLGQAVAQLTGASPATGLTTEILPGTVAGIYLTSSRAEPVTVLGRRGEPFARIGPDGVEVNLKSPTTREQRGRYPDARPAGPDARPRWRRVADEPRFGWIEARTAVTEAPPADVQRADDPTVLRRWNVPVELGGEREVSITGTTSWQPFADPDGVTGGSFPWWLALGGLAALGLIGSVLALRLRRARAGREATGPAASG
ncbi:MAG: hypothetical protein ACR2NA_02190 [Solirubrobacterales bacterium]